MNGQNRRGTAQPGNFEIGAVKHCGPCFANGFPHPVQPPAPGSRCRDGAEISRSSGGAGESLVRHQYKSILGKAVRQSQAKFRNVAPEATRGERKRSGVERCDHVVPLFVLQFPVVVQADVVVGNPAFILGIVETVGRVDQHGGPGSHHFVAVGDAGRDQNLPGPQAAYV